MSSALPLVNRLALHDRDVLVDALVIRAPKTVGVRDLFDLAEALLTPACIDSGLARLSKDRLTAVATGNTDSGLIAECDALLLGDDTHIFDEVRSRAEHWVSRASADSAAKTEPADLPVGPDMAAEADAVTALHEGLIATTLLDDLLAALNNVPARVNGAGTLAKASAAHLDAVMPRSDRDLHELVTWAVSTPLASVRTGAVVINSAEFELWSGMSTPDRWLWLVAAWRDRIPVAGRRLLAMTPWTNAQLEQATGRELVVSNAWIMPSLTEALVIAHTLGLVRGSLVSPAALSALALDDTSLRAFVTAHAPAETESFIVQHDLSIIAPGPLSAKTSAQLRALSHVESRGMASTFRVSADSVSRALAAGADGASLLTFLTDHSLTELPQNLVYLINDLAAKHGSVRVSRVEGRTSIEAATDELAAVLAVDNSVRNLQLTPAGDRTFGTAVEPQSVMNILVQAGYPAISVDAPVLLEPETGDAPDAALHALVSRLRERDEDIPMDASWLKRQLDLAIRNKERVTVTVQMPDGEREFELEVTALANGRLRGRDLRGAVERTLPLSAITAVSAVSAAG